MNESMDELEQHLEIIKDSIRENNEVSLQLLKTRNILIKQCDAIQNELLTRYRLAVKA